MRHRKRTKRVPGERLTQFRCPHPRSIGTALHWPATALERHVPWSMVARSQRWCLSNCNLRYESDRINPARHGVAAARFPAMQALGWLTRLASRFCVRNSLVGPIVAPMRLSGSAFCGSRSCELNSNVHLSCAVQMLSDYCSNARTGKTTPISLSCSTSDGRFCYFMVFIK